MRFKRIMGIYSDLHVGSAFAILPPNYKNRKGNLISLNEGQEKLLQHWNFCRQVCNKHNVDTIILVGDLIQGLNYRNLGEGLILSELNEQKKAAKQLLKSLCKGREVMGVSGTHYHDSRDTKAEEDIINDLGGTYHGYVINGNIKKTKRTINIMHGKTKSSIYRETVASREMLFFKEAEANMKLFKCDILLRGHNHRYLHIHTPSQHYVINPCWQLLEPSEYTMTHYAKWQPWLGMSLLLIDNENRIHSWHFTMKENPHVTDFVKDI